MQSTSTPVKISFDGFLGVNGVTDGLAPYKIYRSTPCDQYDVDYNCISGPPDLCPYIFLTPQIQSIEKVALPFNPFDSQSVARGEFDVPHTLTDDWNIGVQSPCFAGECPTNYDVSKYGYPLAQNLKGQVFQCDVVSTSGEIPQLIRSIGTKSALAATASPSVRVSAVFTGTVMSQPWRVARVSSLFQVFRRVGFTSNHFFVKTSYGNRIPTVM